MKIPKSFNDTLMLNIKVSFFSPQICVCAPRITTTNPSTGSSLWRAPSQDQTWNVLWEWTPWLLLRFIRSSVQRPGTSVLNLIKRKPTRCSLPTISQTRTGLEELLGENRWWSVSNLNLVRFGIQGSGLRFEAAYYWKNWSSPVNNWVCSYYPILSTVIYDCLPEVGKRF